MLYKGVEVGVGVVVGGWGGVIVLVSECVEGDDCVGVWTGQCVCGWVDG